MKLSFNYILLLIIVILSSNYSGIAQNNFSSQIPKAKKYTPTEVITNDYGINLYDRLNFRLNGDSVRDCKGYSCSGWVQDYYVNGALLHKGYYVDGQLKIYKNYYPNGAIERSFTIADDYKSNMKVFYDNGKMRSKAKYLDSDVIKQEDYFEDGSLSYYEEMHKNGEYLVAQKSYYKKDKPESILKLENKSQLLYHKDEYYKNGKKKTEGDLKYSKDLMDYQKIGTWNDYSESGKLKREVLYIDGKINSEKEY